MDPGLLAQDVDQLSQLLGECHLHEERDALAQAMLPLALGQGSCSQGLANASPSSSVVPSPGLAAEAGPWADELMKRLQGCRSQEEGRATCAELLASFHQQQQQDQLDIRLQQMQLQPGSGQSPGPAGAAREADLAARLQSLQGANRVIVRALRVMSERQRQQGSRCQQAEEIAAKLAAELQARDEQLHASERAKAMLQSHLQVLLRREDALDDRGAQVQHLPGRPCS